ncbi:hypothetical protein LPTSP4_27690 [Leptospira ryugenii]|uniref:Protein nucleotidyltransferase YdiU n=1 Tax=Leptospira ryugenii TaxID=1917863 RepID=A0A2P2E2Y7_9LEPT|nr:YdiU family protein [Leptospira ryugenii]GBF51237.1 hypothetical protein LPTSP4_27690 [Leptospira ryugenii]
MTKVQNASYLSLPKLFYKTKGKSQFPSPKMIFWNEDLAQFLQLEEENQDKDLSAQYLCGNLVYENTESIALAYAGHQFGHFTMLGDGRAVLLGEVEAKDKISYDLQLKGSGRTAFSRNGDGRATLTAMLREYLISESMFYLKIPTTRSLAVVETGEFVTREMTQPGAVLTRVAKSHLRVGTFEYVYQFGNEEDLSALLAYATERHFPYLEKTDRYALQFLREVMNLQSSLIVDWMRVGFIHGVMNTDNMSISGETIDYGPCAFMNVYDPSTVFSSIDSQGRYAFGNQASIAHWNLACLANALLPLIHKEEKKSIELAQSTLDEFAKIFMDKYWSMMAKKIGFPKADEDVLQLAKSLLNIMQTYKLDYTNTFINLERSDFDQNKIDPNLKTWIEDWRLVLNQKNLDWNQSLALMEEMNPSFIPRNHLVEEALESARMGEGEKIMSLLQRQKFPYERKDILLLENEIPKGGDAGYVTFCGT